MFALRDILLILFGTVFGFGVDRMKAILDRRVARKQLREELVLNLRLLPFFRRYLENTIAASQRHQMPNMRAIHFANICYQANYAAILPLLSQAERSSYHIIYDHLAICNEISGEASRLFSETVTQEEFGRRIRIVASRFNSLLTTVDKLTEQISQHLDGTPRDVLLPAAPQRE
jgi:hypothetical protein